MKVLLITGFMLASLGKRLKPFAEIRVEAILSPKYEKCQDAMIFTLGEDGLHGWY